MLIRLSTRHDCGMLIAFLLAGLCAAWPAAGDAPADIGEQLKQRLSGSPVQVGSVRIDVEDLEPFYERRGFEPIWVGTNENLSRTDSLVAALKDAAREGLDPEAYAHREIAVRLSRDDVGEQAEVELLASHELLRYLSDLRTGRMALRAADPELFDQPGAIDKVDLIERAAGAPHLGQFLRELAPSNPVYRRLRRVLAEYRRIAAEGGWPQVPKGPSLKRGMMGERVAALRARLTASDDLSLGGRNPQDYDETMVQAVERFQTRHGLEVDGMVGPRTLVELNAPVEERIAQILINMERWRWMPDDLGDRYVLVNLAGYELEVVEDGSTVLDMRVVVGRPYRRTPVFSGRMTYLDFNPYWNITPNIARRDILPKIQEDPGYLSAQGIRIFSGWGENASELGPADIDWALLSAKKFPYRLRQDPGPKNALGRVKFMFPNRFNVYLHDTPSRELFARSVRTFSSGCIRLEKPLEFAEYLLADDPSWTRTRIDRVIEAGTTKTVVLKEPIPIHLTYSTVWFGEGGTIHFRDDVYGRDALLRKVLVP